MPLPGDKANLAGRRNALKDALRGLKGDEHKLATAAVIDMLTCYTEFQRLSRNDVQVRAAKYIQEMKDLPLWAIETACMQIRMGNATGISPVHVPSTIDLRMYVMRWHVAAVRQEAVTIDRILSAVPAGNPEPSKEERARVTIKFRKLVEEMKASIELHTADDPKAERYAQRRLAFDQGVIRQEYDAAGVEPVIINGLMVSPAMLRSIERWPKTAPKSGRGLD